MSRPKHSSPQRRARRRFVGQVVASWMAALLVAAWAFAPRAASGATGPDAPFTVVGTLPVPASFIDANNFPTITKIAVDDRAGLLYEIGVTASGASGIQVVDTATHTLRGEPILLPAQGGSTVGIDSSVVAVDQEDHLLFVGGHWSTGAAGFRRSGVFVVDGRRRTVAHGGVPISAPVSVGNASVQAEVSTNSVDGSAALTYDPQSRRVYLFGGLAPYDGFGGLPQPLYLAAIDPFGASLKWTFPVLGCLWQAAHPTGLPIVYQDGVWVACSFKGNGLLGQVPQLTQGMFRIQLTGGEPPAAAPPGTGVTIYPVPGALDRGAVLGDQEGHRVVFVGPAPGPNLVYVFDVATRRLVGLMGINHGASPGNGCVDRGRGRFYVSASAPPGITSQDYGFLVGEARATGTPYPQLRGYPDFLGLPGLPGFDPVGCDGGRHQVIVHLDGAKDYFILQDNVPAFTNPPPPPDPDQATTGGPYDPAASRLGFEGDGRAFGAQLKLVGGSSAITADFNGGSPPQLPVQVPISSSSPTLTLGASGLPASPQGVTLSDTQATSAAQGVARDGGLQADLALPGAALNQLRDMGPPGSPAPPDQLLDPWPYPTVACAASPGDDAKSAAANGATAGCDPTHDQAAASADAAPQLEIPGVVRVAGVGSSVTSQLDRKTGVLTTTSEAWAKSISLGDGQVEIDNAVAIAVAKAGGQAGTATGSYQRSVGRLLIGGQKICAPCDPAQVAAAVNNNAYTQPTLRVVVPEPAGVPSDHTDHTKYDLPATPGGVVTPGGAQASVTRNQDEMTEDEIINELSPYDGEIPALRLELQNNTFKHPDLLLDLAAPQAYSRLNILPSSPPPPPDETTTTTAPPAGGDNQGSTSTGASANDDSGSSAQAATDTGAGTGAPSETPASSEPVGPPPGAVGFSPSASSGSGSSNAPATYTSSGNESATSIGGPPAGAAGFPGLPSKALGQLGRGLKAALSSPSKFFELLLIWAVMALPVYLVARRRLVVDYILAPTQEIQ